MKNRSIGSKISQAIQKKMINSDPSHGANWELNK